MKNIYPHPFLTLCFLFVLSSCAPTVRIATPEPVKIDVGMRVDVYTHDDETKDKQDSTNPEKKTARQRRRDRMAEVQNLKNDRLIGEGNNGLLAMRDKPTDPAYASYAQKVIQEENKDREEIFKIEADLQKKPVSAIIKKFSKESKEAAFPNEWIQEENGNWKQR